MISIRCSSPDFSALLAEHIENELGVQCVAQAESVIDGDAFLRQAPVRLNEVLRQIRQQLLSAPLAGLVFDSAARALACTHTGRTVSLTDKEADIYTHLRLVYPSAADKKTMLGVLWQGEVDSHALETHIYRLRNKLRELGASLQIEANDKSYGLQV